jgi:hypothetical protein
MLCSGMREGTVAPTKADKSLPSVKVNASASHHIFKSTPHLLFAAADLCGWPCLLEVGKPQNLLDAVAAEDSRRRTRRGTMRWLTFPRQGPGRKTQAEAQDREQERRARAKRRRAGIPHPNAGFNTQPPSLPLPLARARRGERPRSAYAVCATADLPLRELQQSLTSFEKLDPIARPRNPYARSFSVATRSRSSAIAHDAACILQLSNFEFVDGVQFGFQIARHPRTQRNPARRARRRRGA